MTHTEREWWETELLVARLIEEDEKKTPSKKLAAPLAKFLCAWDKRGGGRCGLEDGIGPVLVLRLGERATPENAKGRTAILIASRTETLLNLYARAGYARDSGAERVFAFCPSLVREKDVAMLEKRCDGIFVADPIAGGGPSRTIGKKGMILRTVRPPSGIDPTARYYAANTVP